MSYRLTTSERRLLAAIRQKLPNPGDTLTPYQNGRMPWTLEPHRSFQPRPPGWSYKTFYVLRDKGLIKIDHGYAGSVIVSLTGPADLDAVESKALQKVLAAADKSEDGRVGLQPDAHRMRYLPGDSLGRKESTYESLRDKGFIEIEFGDKGSTGAWWIRPTALGEGVA